MLFITSLLYRNALRLFTNKKIKYRLQSNIPNVLVRKWHIYSFIGSSNKQGDVADLHRNLHFTPERCEIKLAQSLLFVYILHLVDLFGSSIFSSVVIPRLPILTVSQSEVQNPVVKKLLSLGCHTSYDSFSFKINLIGIKQCTLTFCIGSTLRLTFTKVQVMTYNFRLEMMHRRLNIMRTLPTRPKNTAKLLSWEY